MQPGPNIADLFIQGRRVIHRHAELLVTDNRVVWEHVAPTEAVCVAVPSGDVDLADESEVRAAVKASRNRRVDKTVEIVTKVPADGVLSPVNGPRRRLLVRKAEELSGHGSHQVAAAHYVAAGLGLLARKELTVAAALLARQGEADRAKRCRDEAATIDPIWGETQAYDFDDDEEILGEVWDRLEREGLPGRPMDPKDYERALREFGRERGGDDS